MNPSDWDILAGLDPYWSIMSARDKQYGSWDESEFFRTGEDQIAETVARARILGLPSAWQQALDSGCGVGRLTRALTKWFDLVYGVDASSTMVALATSRNWRFPNCRFAVSSEEKHDMFGSAQFDLIYSWEVLQNTRNESVGASLIREYVRLLKPKGLLIFQCPNYVRRTLVAGRCQSLKWLLKSAGVTRGAAYETLRALKFDPEFLYTRLKLYPEVGVRSMPETEVRRLLSSTGARIVDVQIGAFAGLEGENRIYWVTK